MSKINNTMSGVTAVQLSEEAPDVFGIMDLQIIWTIAPEYAILYGNSLLIKNRIQIDYDYGITIQTRITRV